MFRLPMLVVKVALVVLGLVVLTTASQAQEPKSRTQGQGQGERSFRGPDGHYRRQDNTTEIALQVASGIRGRSRRRRRSAYLTPGVHVHFFADMNSADVAPEPMTEITVCDITRERTADLYPGRSDQGREERQGCGQQDGSSRHHQGQQERQVDDGLPSQTLKKSASQDHPSPGCQGGGAFQRPIDGSPGRRSGVP